MSKKTYEVTVESPYGNQPLSQWEHWMNKVSDEALTRWGIEIQINEQSDEGASTEEFK